MIVGSFKLTEELSDGLAVLATTHERVRAQAEEEDSPLSPYVAFGSLALHNAHGKYITGFRLTEDSALGRHNGRLTYVSGLWRVDGVDQDAMLVLDAASHWKFEDQPHMIGALVREFEIIPPKDEELPTEQG